MSDAEHQSHLQHHFENEDQQYQSAKLGMWTFLATEILFFGGLFVAYTVYRVNNPEIFIYAHQFLDKNLGALNTVILICSSFTMAWAVRAAQLRQKKILQLMLVLTFVFACGFLGVKSVEYNQKWKHGLLWAGAYNPEGSHGEEEHSATAEGIHAEPSEVVQTEIVVDEQEVVQTETVVEEQAPAAASEPEVAKDPDLSLVPPAAVGPAGLADDKDHEDDHHVIAEDPGNAKVFFSIYFMMTGLHGIHVVLGMAAMLWLMFKTRRGDFDGGHFTPVDMVGLYWHLVDLIWIYLFLLLYLIH